MGPGSSSGTESRSCVVFDQPLRRHRRRPHRVDGEYLVHSCASGGSRACARTSLAHRDPRRERPSAPDRKPTSSRGSESWSERHEGPGRGTEPRPLCAANRGVYRPVLRRVLASVEIDPATSAGVTVGVPAACDCPSIRASRGSWPSWCRSCWLPARRRTAPGTEPIPGSSDAPARQPVTPALASGGGVFG